MALWNPRSWSFWPFLPAAEIPRPADSATPAKSEATGRQDALLWLAGGNPFLPADGGFSPAPAASFMTYRWMENSWPSLQLAYAMSLAPMLRPYTVEAEKGAPQEGKDLIEKAIIPHLPDLIRAMFRAVVLRFAPFEIPWILKDGYQVPAKFKPLVQDFTTILIAKGTDEVVGVRQSNPENRDIVGANAFVYANEPERVPVYGYSLCENLREDIWWPWRETMQNVGRMGKKATGITFAVYGPPDPNWTFTRPDGTSRTAAQVAFDAAEKLKQGITVFLPNKTNMMKNATAKEYAEWAKQTDFPIEHYDLGDTGPGLQGMLKVLEYCDAQGFRGFGWPERSGLQGQHGTNAESETQGQLGLETAQQRREDFAEGISQGPVNHLIRLNLGPQLVDKYKLKPTPLIDDEMVVLHKILDGLLSSGMAGRVAANTDMRLMWQRLKIPPFGQALDDPLQWLNPPVQNVPGGTPGTDEGPPEPGGNGEAGDDSSTAIAARLGRIVLDIGGYGENGDGSLVMAGDNCGTGAGGFKPGNDCAAGKKGGGKTFGEIKNFGDVVKFNGRLYKVVGFEGDDEIGIELVEPDADVDPGDNATRVHISEVELVKSNTPKKKK